MDQSEQPMDSSEKEKSNKDRPEADFDFDTATMKISLVEKRSGDEALNVEKILGLNGLELDRLQLPELENDTQEEWDKYTTLGIISSTQTRSVCLAQDENTHRLVTIKILNNHPDLDPDQIQRFLDEALIQSQLQTSNILPVYDVGIDTVGQLYYSTPYIGKNTLKEFFHQASYPELLFIFRQICKAVTAIHSKKVLHRNLCPSNITIDNNGIPYIDGWEACRVQNRGIEIFDYSNNEKLRSCGQLQTIDRRLVGHLPYMSREIISEKIKYIDERADVYSLGAVLYTLLTDCTPWEGMKFEQMAMAICKDKIDIPKKGKRFKVSRPLRKVLANALADKLQRYQTVDELISEFDKAIF